MKIIKKSKIYFALIKKDPIFASTNPIRPVRLPVRTPDFHSGNRGSIPLRATKATSKESLFLIHSTYQNIFIC